MCSVESSCTFSNLHARAKISRVLREEHSQIVQCQKPFLEFCHYPSNNKLFLLLAAFKFHTENNLNYFNSVIITVLWWDCIHLQPVFGTVVTRSASRLRAIGKCSVNLTYYNGTRAFIKCSSSREISDYSLNVALNEY